MTVIKTLTDVLQAVILSMPLKRNTQGVCLGFLMVSFHLNIKKSILLILIQGKMSPQWWCTNKIRYSLQKR